MSYYKPPGVYPEKVANAGMVSLWQGARIPVIVGRGQRTVVVTAPITNHTLGGTDQLPEAATSIVRVGDYPDQIKYVETTDYLFTGTTSSPSTSIDWSPGGSEPASGATYFVTYRKLAPSDVYQYNLYTNENEIISRHGPESVTNLVTVGGVVALRQGCPAVGIIQINLEDTGAYPSGGPDDPTPADYHAAFINALDILELLDTDQVRYVIPMTVQDSLTYPTLSEYLTHVDTMSLTSQRRWRMMIRGRQATESQRNSVVRDAFVTIASGYRAHNSARRMIVVSPGEIHRVITDPSTGRASNTLFDGSVLAAAAAGKICSYTNPAMPITMKDFGSVTLGRTFSNADMNIMAGNGVAQFWYKGRSMKCRHGLTTDLTNANTQEISVVEIEDHIKVQSIFVLENRYIGAMFTTELLASIRASVVSFWSQLVNEQVIAEFDSGSVSVAADPNDPRICNIFGRIKPIYPLNWIDLRFQFYAGGSGEFNA